MLFANDVVLVDESQTGVSRTKTEYMRYDFSYTTHKEGEVSLEGQVVPKKDTFCYLRSMLQNDGDIDAGVYHRINAGGGTTKA